MTKWCESTLECFSDTFLFLWELMNHSITSHTLNLSGKITSTILTFDTVSQKVFPVFKVSNLWKLQKKKQQNESKAKKKKCPQMSTYNIWWCINIRINILGSLLYPVIEQKVVFRCLCLEEVVCSVLQEIDEANDFARLWSALIFFYFRSEWDQILSRTANSFTW